MCMCRWMCTSPVHCWEVKKWLSWPIFHHEFHVPHLLFLRVCWLFKAERTNILLFKSVQMTILWRMCNRTKHFNILQSSKYFCSELTAAEKAAWSLFLWLSLYCLYKRKLNTWRELALFFSCPEKQNTEMVQTYWWDQRTKVQWKSTPTQKVTKCQAPKNM